MRTTITDTLTARVILAALLVSCGSRVDMDPIAHKADVDAWREYRYNLLHQEGWLLLTGLHWLNDGENSVGGAAENDVVFQRTGVPSRIGTIVVSDSLVTMSVAPNVTVMHDGVAVREITMTPGSWANATVLRLGSLNWHIIGRGGRYAVRVRDSLATSLLAFDSIPSYPLNPAWRFQARFEPYDPPKTIQVPNILGTVNDSPSPGAVVFTIGMKRHRLDVLGAPSDSSFWIQFGDETNGIDTYGGGRYIWVNAPDEDGRTILDFNKAYNPPCVFTPYATCPLPPRQNRLAIAIDAGELKYRSP